MTRPANTFITLLGSNIIEGLKVTDAGALAITWTDGRIFNVSGDVVVTIEAGGDDVTDDDTSYLVWDSSNALELQLTTAAGNQVLIATIVAAAGDITSVTEAGFDYTNVTGLSGRPTIRKGGVLDSDDYLTDGEIVVIKETEIPPRNLGENRDEKYLLTGFIFFAGATGDRTINEMKAEVRRLMNVNSDDPTRTWYFEFRNTDFDLDYTLGKIMFQVDAIQVLVTAIA